MIRSFRDQDTRRIFQREPSRRVPASLQQRALRKLVMIDAAAELADLLAPPGNRLEKLSGDRTGQYSIRINDQWRICFVWTQGEASDVEIVDYH